MEQCRFTDAELDERRLPTPQEQQALLLAYILARAQYYRALDVPIVYEAPAHE